MTDLHQQLDRLAHDPTFTPTDLDRVAQQGRRELRSRRRRHGAGLLAGGLALSVVTFLGWDTVTGPSLDFGDPAGVPAAAGIPASVAYPDLVKSVRGEGYVEISGFGWPIEGMPVVSGLDGSLSLPPIDRADGEAMCLPMLEQAAPEVPAVKWRHSGSGIDEFPLRATLSMTVEAEHDGVAYLATCALPGDQPPNTRRDLTQVPDPTQLDEHDEVLGQCSYLAHVDFSGWQVEAGARLGRLSVSVLTSADDHVATCVLSDVGSGRAVRISELTEVPTGEDPLVYDTSRAGFAVAGRAPTGAASVELKVNGQDPVSAPVTQGVFAAVAEPVQGEPVARLTAYDARGVEQASWSTTTPGGGGSLLPADCFYTVERDPGAC